MEMQKKGKYTKSQNILFAGIIGVVIIVVAVVWISGYTDYYFGVFVKNQEDSEGVLEKNGALELNEQEQTLIRPLEEAFDSYRNRRLCDPVSATAFDGASLTGGFYYEGSDVTVIALHGIRSTKDSDFLFAPYYGELNYNLLIPDARTNGGSGGEYMGYGHFEKDDLLSWIDWLVDTYGDKQQIIIHGTAAGAAAALLAAGDGLSENVKLLVLDSPYSSLSDIASYQIENLYGLPKFPFIPLINSRLEKEAGYRMADVDVIAAISDADITIPALFIVGVENDYIPAGQSVAVYEAYPARKELVSVSGARYRMTYGAAQEECENALSAMLRSVVAKGSI